MAYDISVSSAVDFLKSQYKRGDIVLYDGRPVIFLGFGEGITASIFFENGSVWNKNIKDLSKYTGTLKNDNFARFLKLKFYGIRNFRNNFSRFY